MNVINIKSTNKYFDICNDACKEFISKYGYDSSIQCYPEKARWVVLIWCATGKIENGGFHYLFETPFPGDPQYEFTLNAFNKIGCAEAYEVMKKAFGLFAENKPPLDDDVRISQYKQAPERIRDEIDFKFWDCIIKITEALANYIINNKLNQI